MFGFFAVRILDGGLGRIRLCGDVWAVRPSTKLCKARFLRKAAMGSDRSIRRFGLEPDFRCDLREGRVFDFGSVFMT